MRKTKLVLLLGIALALAACGDSNNYTTAMPDDNAPDTSLTYLAYVQKMIGTASDDNEPWDIDTVQVEVSDTGEAVDVM